MTKLEPTPVFQNDPEQTVKPKTNWLKFSVLLNVLLFIIWGLLVINPTVRFAVSYPNEAAVFAKSYLLLEREATKAATDARNKALKEWVERSKVK